MRKITFDSAGRWKEELTPAYTFRYRETPLFTQCEDHITTCINPCHPEKFDNISLLFPEIQAVGVKARLRCSFDAEGCPEIILIEKTEKCEDGVLRYGACFEIVLYKNGVNIWRHYMDEADHRCYWHKRIGLEMPVAEGEIHILEVEVLKEHILFSINGISLRVRTEDLFERFYIGLTACEGIVRLYDFEIES